MDNKKTKNKNSENKKVENKQSGDDQIFRKSSLAKLSSPEHLDQLIKVTDSKGWLALIGAMTLISLTLVWSVVAKLPRKVNGTGILIKSGGVKSIAHRFGGTISDLTISEGDYVERGDVIGRLAFNDLLIQISNARFELSILKEKLNRHREFSGKNEILKEDFFTIHQRSKEESLSDYERDIDAQKRKLVSQENLFELGAISMEELNRSKQMLDQLESARDSVISSLKQLKIDELSFSNNSDTNILNLENSVREQEKMIERLQGKLDESSKIVSLYSGKVVAVNIDKGSIISPGQSLAVIEIDAKDVRNLEAVVFIPAMEAKKINIGNDAQISPSTVSASEYGVMLGKVTKVGDYVASPQYISKLLGEEAARKYSRMSDPIEIIVDLIPEDNDSGYKWSSSGPPIKIKTGTPAFSAIVVKKQRPITMIFPILASVLD